MRSKLQFGVLLMVSVWMAVLSATGQQIQAAAPAAAAVPNLIKFSGVLRDGDGTLITNLSGVTILIYKDEQGGAPLWMETQSVQPDKAGHYTVQLGSASKNGLPPDVFMTGEARWLAVQIGTEAEQPRIALVSVPYALKAGDAATLGGLPASAFVLATPSSGNAAASSTPSEPGASTTAPPPTSSAVTTSGGTVNAIPLFTTATNIQNSILTQSGTSAINVRGVLNSPAKGTATATAGFNSQPHDFVASVFNGIAAVPQTFQWQAEPANNGNNTATGTLNLLFGSGTTRPTETGLKIANNGQITFASGQTFPGTGSGTVTSVASGSGLTGGPITGSGTLSIANGGVTNAMLANPSLTVNAGTALTGGGAVSLGGSTTLNVDTTKIPQLATANTFTGNETFTGTLNISSTSTYQPIQVQSSSTFGTWLELSNTSAGGQTWNILSAASGNAEGAGNLGITNLKGGKIWLEGPVAASGSVDVAGLQHTLIGNTGCGGAFGGIGFGASGLADCTHYSLLGEGVHTYLNRPAGGQMLFREGNNTEMVLASGGNLGIGTATPSYLLHVNGTMRAEAGLSMGGNAVLSIDKPGVPGGQLLVQNGTVSIGGDTPMSSNPHMSFSGFFLGSLCAGNAKCGGGNGFPTGGLVPDKNILLTHMTASLTNSIDPSCLPGNIQVLNRSPVFLIAEVPLKGDILGYEDGTLNPPVPVSAGTQLWVVVELDNTNNCNVGVSAGGNAFVNVQYVMQ